MYYNGYGTSKKQKNAIVWLRMSANKGSTKALAALRKLNETKKGNNQD